MLLQLVRSRTRRSMLNALSIMNRQRSVRQHFHLAQAKFVEIGLKVMEG